MSKYQTRSQRNASKAKHLAVRQLKAGEAVPFEGRWWMLATELRYADRQLFGQPVCHTDRPWRLP